MNRLADCRLRLHPPATARTDAEDREAFYSDFAAVFSKLIELGVTRDDDYESAPTMSKEAGDEKEREAKSKM